MTTGSTSVLPFSEGNFDANPCIFAVIGGSGVYKMKMLVGAVFYHVETPFGAPSDAVAVANVSGVRCAFLPRHGRDHIFTPSEVNYRANIFALKKLGVQYLLSISAQGSLTEEMTPGDLVVVSQFFDRTYLRKNTFFGNGIVGHVPFGEPTCPVFRKLAVDTMRKALPDVTVHNGGTSVTMEGPQFSSKAESLNNKRMGAHLIGMTTVTESKLAREAEMAHCVVAMVTDMDAWTDEPHVDVSKVMATLEKNGANAQIYPQAIVEAFVAHGPWESEAHHAMQFAVMTHVDAIPEKVKEDLAPLLAKYPKFHPKRSTN
jgi:5'-methylthioadenosine phosphorylase